MKKIQVKAIQLGIIAFVAMSFGACANVENLQATNVPVHGGEAKIGQSECSWIFGFSYKTCSIDEAVKNGKITSIQAIEVQSFRTFFYDTKTITVRGK